MSWLICKVMHCPAVEVFVKKYTASYSKLMSSRTVTPGPANPATLSKIHATFSYTLVDCTALVSTAQQSKPEDPKESSLALRLK